MITYNIPKMKKYHLFIYLIPVILLSSCGVGKNLTKKDLKTTSFMPNEVRLNLTLDDFVFLGEDEVVIEYKKVLGFTILTLINGKPVDRNQINSIDLHGRTYIYIQPGMERALFETHRTIPDADILIPIYTLTEKHNMFLASDIKKTLKVKAYKFNH